MEKELFDKFYKTLLSKASAKRKEKEKEYFSEEDVLGSLRKVARLRNKETPQMIMDLVAKPMQSLSDMVDAEFPSYGVITVDERAPMALWEEKFVDTLNYLFKLYAAIREARHE